MDIREKLVEQLRELADVDPPICQYQVPEEIELFGKKVTVYCKPFEQFQEVLREAADYIANGVTVQKWIPVTERLPNIFEGVLAYCPKRRNTYLLYLNARGEWHFFDKTVSGALLDEDVTHWVPLPTPPKGE